MKMAMGNMTKMEVAKALVAAEPKGVKTQIICSAVCYGVCALILAGFYLARFSSVVNGQTIAEDSMGAAYDSDIIYYDVGCILPAAGAYAEVMARQGDSAMGEAAMKAKGYESASDAWDNIKTISDDCDEDCLKAGTKWSDVYIANGIILLMIVCNMICVGIGACNAVCRLTGSICANLLCCAHFGIVIATAVYRFRPMGALCSKLPENTNIPTTEPADVDDAWTYVKDGELILACWIIQFLCCCCCCGAGNRPLVPQKPM